jgi:hypothetical protein
MKTQLTLALCAMFVAGAGHAAENQSRLANELERVSAHIGSHTDERAVAKSLYHQVRAHVKVTRHNLKPTEINQRVREYISKKYTPLLLLKYSEVSNKMKEANRHFSDCSKPEPFRYSEHVETAMCTVLHKGYIHVRYLVNEQQHGWEETSEFVFRHEHQTLKLIGIKLNLKNNQKVHVDGI